MPSYLVRELAFEPAHNIPLSVLSAKIASTHTRTENQGKEVTRPVRDVLKYPSLCCQSHHRATDGSDCWAHPLPLTQRTYYKPTYGQRKLRHEPRLARLLAVAAPKKASPTCCPLAACCLLGCLPTGTCSCPDSSTGADCFYVQLRTSNQ